MEKAVLTMQIKPGSRVIIGHDITVTVTNRQVGVTTVRIEVCKQTYSVSLGFDEMHEIKRDVSIVVLRKQSGGGVRMGFQVDPATMIYREEALRKIRQARIMKKKERTTA